MGRLILQEDWINQHLTNSWVLNQVGRRNLQVIPNMIDLCKAFQLWLRQLSLAVRGKGKELCRVRIRINQPRRRLHPLKVKREIFLLPLLNKTLLSLVWVVVKSVIPRKSRIIMLQLELLELIQCNRNSKRSEYRTSKNSCLKNNSECYIPETSSSKTENRRNSWWVLSVNKWRGISIT